MEFNVCVILDNMRAASANGKLSEKDLRGIFDYYVLPRDRDIVTTVYNAVLWDVHEGSFMEELKDTYIAKGYVDTYINQFTACLMNDEDFRQMAANMNKIDYSGYETCTYTLADFCKDLPDKYNDFKLGILI